MRIDAWGQHPKSYDVDLALGPVPYDTVTQVWLLLEL